MNDEMDVTVLQQRRMHRSLTLEILMFSRSRGPSSWGGATLHTLGRYTIDDVPLAAN